jgi:hypothetical protein
MKTKLYKILGVALTLVLLASLTVGLTTFPAGAADTSNLKFSKLELPLVEDWGGGGDWAGFADPEGDYWCAWGTDVGPIAITPEGDALFAAVADYPYDGSAWYEVLKSLDGGYSWTVSGFYDEASGVPDFTRIVDIVTSPEYGDDTTVCVATQAFVYISDDGGKNFIALANPWADGVTDPVITDMDVTVAEDGDLAILVTTAYGEDDETDVWVAKGLLAWTNQDIQGNVGADGSLPATDAVLAGAFLPTFANDGDIGICAIVTDDGGPTTTITFSFADVGDGGEWGDDIANGPFTNSEGDAFNSDWARIAFPDDFDAFGIGNNVCFAGLVEDGFLGAFDLDELNGSDAYKVVLKEAGTSSTTDLDVRDVITTLLPTATAITSIDVCGDAEAATILVGTDCIDLTDTPECFASYLSEDSGDSWQFSFKGPTGGDEFLGDLIYLDTRTQVLMAPDFCSSGEAFASTRGDYTSAFSHTADANASWNQISIVDYAANEDYWITDFGFNAYNYIAEDQLWMITNSLGGDAALWGRLDGMHFERILSYATRGVTDNLFQLQILGDGSGFFAADFAAGAIWRSTDMGATWPKKISTKDNLQWVAPVSTTTLYTAHAGGEIWWTTRSGTGWEEPDDSEIPAGATVNNVFVMGDIVYGGLSNGQVYISSDGGETVEIVGDTGPFTPPAFVPVTLAGVDLGFGDNGIMYATNPMDGSVMRAEVDLDDPGDATWKRIDDNQDSTGLPVEYDENNFWAGGPPVCLPPSGILYIADTSPADGDTGGLWRCTNPTADTDSVVPPYFERENKGLDNNAMLGFRSLDLEPPNLTPTLFFADTWTGDYREQIVFFTDILNVGVPLADPAADATGVGLLPEGYVYPEVILLWQEMAGATSYQYQVAIDPDFKTKVADGFTTSLASPELELQPNTNYYWRARVADEGTLLGAPLISPWSETWKFKTAIGASMARPELQAPWPGEPDVPLSPTFEWSGIEWAEVYEYELAIDPTTTAGGYFTEPLVALVGTNSLVSTAWKCDIALDYNTRYYWHVKAIGVDTDTPWSDVGTFTTMGEPSTAAPTQQVIEIPPAQEITPAWIWAVVIIGAILVIAVIVLIVTTRRVP